MSGEWLVDPSLPWEVVGLRFEADGKLTQIRLRRHRDPNDQSGRAESRATVRARDGALIVVREGT